MGSLGGGEIVFIAIVALLLFGPKRLPEIGRSVGKALAELRRATNELKGGLTAGFEDLNEPLFLHGPIMPKRVMPEVPLAGPSTPPPVAAPTEPPPSATSLSPSKTSVGPSNTSVGPSKTSVGPSKTSVGPSKTSVGPSNTDIPNPGPSGEDEASTR